MISLLWRFFPGPAWFRVMVIIAALAALVWVTIAYIYPWVALQLPESEVTITE